MTLHITFWYPFLHGRNSHAMVGPVWPLLTWWTRKRSNYECIATRGSPMPRSRYLLNFVAVPSLNSLSLYVAVLVRFYCLYITLHFDLELWPRDLDLWPWTYVVDRLRHAQTLYKIWAKSDNPRQSYCDLNIWPYDLEHVSRAPLFCGIVCTKFKLSQAVRSWNVTIFPC